MELEDLYDENSGDMVPWSTVVVPPTLEIPAFLRRAFPFPFQPDRVNESGECCSTHCPVDEPHLAGLYYHDLKQQRVKGPRSQWFGDSEAPPEVWKAVARLCAGDQDNTPDFDVDFDVDMVREFRHCHYYTFNEQGEWDGDKIIRDAKATYKNALRVYKLEEEGVDAGAVVGTKTLSALVAAGANLASVGIAAVAAADISASDATVAALLAQVGTAHPTAAANGVPNADTDSGSDYADTTTTTTMTTATTSPDATAAGIGLRPFDADAIADAVADGVADAVVDVIKDNFPAPIADAVTDAVAERVADAVVDAITEVTKRFSSASTIAAASPPPIVRDEFWDSF